MLVYYGFQSEGFLKSQKLTGIRWANMQIRNMLRKICKTVIKLRKRSSTLIASWLFRLPDSVHPDSYKVINFPPQCQTSKKKIWLKVQCDCYLMIRSWSDHSATFLFSIQRSKFTWWESSRKQMHFSHSVSFPLLWSFLMFVLNAALAAKSR